MDTDTGKPGAPRRTTPAPAPSQHAGPNLGAQSGAQGDEPDRAVLRANTHADTGRAQVHAHFAAHLSVHTVVPSTAFKVRGHEAGRSFVIRCCGTPARAAQYADEAFHERRDGAGQWRQVERKVRSRNPNCLYVVRDRSQAQVEG